MDVVWFAEIKWDYLRTRKQQLVRRRPDDVRVLFLEPRKRGEPAPTGVRERDGVLVATVPFLKAPGNSPLRWPLRLAAVRAAVDARAARAVRRAVARASMRPDVAVVSNVYAVRAVRGLGVRPVVYDCNDAHTDFPGMPPWTRDYFAALCRLADRVFVTADALADDVAAVRGSRDAVERVGNGVDVAMFEAARARVGRRGHDGVVVGYLGAVAPWFDFDAMAALADAHPDWRVEIVGPVLLGAGAELEALARRDNVRVREAVEHEAVPGVLAGFDVGVIPFRGGALTRGVNPNKMYEYLAMGLPVAATRFSTEVERYPDVVAVGEGVGGFVDACERAVARAREGGDALRRRAFAVAAANDWDAIARRFWDRVRERVAQKG